VRKFRRKWIAETILNFQINISVLQASIVEEVISFSALDNLRDLTCVSLLAICIDDMTARFHYGKQVRRCQLLSDVACDPYSIQLQNHKFWKSEKGVLLPFHSNES